MFLSNKSKEIASEAIKFSKFSGGGPETPRQLGDEIKKINVKNVFI